MVDEVFVACPDAPWALISNRGTVMSARVGRSTKQRWREVGHLDPQGYRTVGFRETGVMRVHRLVAKAFIGPPPFDGALVRHLNGDKLDNRVENLAWGTHAENTADMLRLGEIKTGPENPCWTDVCSSGHVRTEENTYYPPKGGRMCRDCRREKDLERYHRLMAEGRHPRQLARKSSSASA